MKKLAIALTAIAAFTAPAVAADMPVRAPVYQPPVPVYNWTGFYIFGGGGGGLWERRQQRGGPSPGVGFSRDQRLGGSGWYWNSRRRVGLAVKPIMGVRHIWRWSIRRDPRLTVGPN